MWLFAIWLTVAVFEKVAMSRAICFMSDSQLHVDLKLVIFSACKFKLDLHAEKVANFQYSMQL